MYFAFETDAATILLSLGCGTCNPKPFGDGILFVDSHIKLFLCLSSALTINDDSDYLARKIVLDKLRAAIHRS